jgi:hypothetical protein
LCPGYRDQLSLMFRDESTKVIQKAHAQWGVPESAAQPQSQSGESSSSSPTSVSPSAASSARSRTSISSERPRSKASISLDGGNLNLPQMQREIYATKSDQAIRFFLERYVVGLPDEPRAPQELQGLKWVSAPEMQPIMAAVGLASLSNLTGDKEMYTLARQKYGTALQHVVTSITNLQGLDLEVSIRTVVMLAMFEVRLKRPAQHVSAISWLAEYPTNHFCTFTGCPRPYGTHQHCAHDPVLVAAAVPGANRARPQEAVPERGCRYCVA